VSKSALHLVTCHGVPDCLPHDQTDARFDVEADVRVASGVDTRTWLEVQDERRAAGTPSATDRGREVPAARQAVRTGQHHEAPRITADERVPRTRSDRETLAALGATGREDRATGTRAHAEAEAVRLGATAVVRLVRTLAHEDLRLSVMGVCGDRGCSAWPF
jgi:hypothetical protein